MRAILPTVIYLLAVSCGAPRDEEGQGDVDSTAVIAPDAGLSSAAALDTVVAEAFTEDDSATTEPFTRIATALIDTALSHYDPGAKVTDTIVGINECIGEDVVRETYANGLTRTGHLYNIYASEWLFEGRFNELLGLEPGMTREAVRAKLGVPQREGADTLRFLSEKPQGYEADYFDARWKLDCIFGGSTLEALRFTPSFDDC